MKCSIAMLTLGIAGFAGLSPAQNTDPKAMFEHVRSIQQAGTIAEANYTIQQYEDGNQVSHDSFQGRVQDTNYYYYQKHAIEPGVTRHTYFARMDDITSTFLDVDGEEKLTKPEARKFVPSGQVKHGAKPPGLNLYNAVWTAFGNATIDRYYTVLEKGTPQLQSTGEYRTVAVIDWDGQFNSGIELQHPRVDYTFDKQDRLIRIRWGSVPAEPYLHDLALREGIDWLDLFTVSEEAELGNHVRVASVDVATNIIHWVYGENVDELKQSRDLHEKGQIDDLELIARITRSKDAEHRFQIFMKVIHIDPQSIKLGNTYSREDFLITFPAGTLVIDEVAGSNYTVGSKDEDQIQEIVEEMQSDLKGVASTERSLQTPKEGSASTTPEATSPNLQGVRIWMLGTVALVLSGLIFWRLRRYARK